MPAQQQSEIHVLPESTGKLVYAARQKSAVHAGLELTKFVNWKCERKEPKADTEAALQNVCNSLARAGKPLAQAWRTRRAAWLSACGGRGRVIVVETQSPCVLWLAAPTALEAGFCLHHTYGVPYLPGSGLKGLARRACMIENRGSDEQPDADTLRLFGEAGDKGHPGLVDFLDGVPVDAACLERDVMSPHHMEYYSGRESIPHDCESPIPVKFLRIRVGAQFEIALLARGRDDKEAGHDLDAAERYLLEGLAELGLGAKTNSGYGVFARVEGQTASQPLARESAPAKVTAASKQEVEARATKLDKHAVVFEDDAGNTYRADRRELETRSGLKAAGWHDRIGNRQRFTLTIDGGRVVAVVPRKGK
jgi:CRISPR-associated protein Cmr6